MLFILPKIITLFIGRSELNQIDLIINLLGTPNESIWPVNNNQIYETNKNFTYFQIIYQGIS